MMKENKMYKQVQQWLSNLDLLDRLGIPYSVLRDLKQRYQNPKIRPASHVLRRDYRFLEEKVKQS